METLREIGTLGAVRGNGALSRWTGGEAVGRAVLLGDSAAVSRLRSQVQRIGPYFRTALLTGEPGTGKETVARALHGLSAGAGGPFIVCDLKLLGHRGMRVAEEVDALLRSAEDGTLFVHDIGEMPAALQAGFLGMLEHVSQPRVRAGGDRRLPVRVVAATSHDLRTMAMAGRFRQDLYARLSVVEIGLPALRSRLEDLGAIAEGIVREAGCAAGVSAAAVQALSAYAWPGNIGELRGVLDEAMMAAMDGAVEARHVPVPARGGRTLAADRQEVKVDRLDMVIERHVLEVLTRCGGNKLRTAALLGISRSTLYRMLESGSSSRSVAVSAVAVSGLAVLA